MPQKPWPRPPKTTMLCRICGEQKTESEFHPSNWVGAITRSKCKSCLQSYQHEQYHKRGRKSLMAGRREQRLEMVNAIKSARGCKECSETHPACLDFHHRDPMEKSVGVGTLVARSTPAETILAEIAKCDVLCSNCHRKHHWGQSRPRRAKQERSVSQVLPLRLSQSA